MDQPPPDLAFEPAPTRRGMPRLVLGVAAGLVVLAALAAAGVTVFLLAAGRGTVLDRMVPAGVGVYASLSLDPPADQKLDLLNLSHKFPELSDQQQIDKNLDQLLKPLGLSYSGDVQPWLGAQVVAVGGGASKPSVALLFDSKDDAAAQKALAKLKTGALGRQVGWHTAQHGGVTLQVGFLQSQTEVLAFFDHTLLVASSESLADQVIDTDQGKHARLDSTAEYKSATAKLPASRLVTVFVDGPAVTGWTGDIFDQLSKGLSPGSGLTITPPPIDKSSLTQSLAAFKGAAFSISARPDGLAADLEVDVDASKLTPDQRAIYQQPGRPNSALDSVPQGAVAVFGISDLDTIAKNIPTGGAPGLGLAPFSGIFKSLTGDAALEVEPDGRSIGVGGVIGTSDPAALKALLDSLAGSTTGITLSSAVSGQDLLVASSPAELQRMQAAQSGGSIASSSAYRQAADFSVANPAGVLYVDVDGVFGLAGSAGGLGGNADFQKARSDWAAVHTVLLTSGGTSVRLHLVIG